MLLTTSESQTFTNFLSAAANAVAQESLGNMRTVSAFNAQQRTAEKYSEVVLQYSLGK